MHNYPQMQIPHSTVILKYEDDVSLPLSESLWRREKRKVLYFHVFCENICTDC
jgi:hypothetical protein